jgi:hypothetical protein
VCALPLTGSDVGRRADQLVRAPALGGLVHFLLGVVFMLATGCAMVIARQVLRPGALPFIRVRAGGGDVDASCWRRIDAGSAGRVGVACQRRQGCEAGTWPGRTSGWRPRERREGRGGSGWRLPAAAAGASPPQLPLSRRCIAPPKPAAVPQDPTAPDRNPFKEMLDAPLLHHLGRVVLSGAIYAALAVLAVHLPALAARAAAPALFPLRLQLFDPLTQIPADMLVFHVLVPLVTIEHERLRAALRAGLRAWLRLAGRLLGLEAYLLPPDAREAQQEVPPGVAAGEAAAGEGAAAAAAAAVAAEGAGGERAAAEGGDAAGAAAPPPPPPPLAVAGAAGRLGLGPAEAAATAAPAPMAAAADEVLPAAAGTGRAAAAAERPAAAAGEQQQLQQPLPPPRQQPRRFRWRPWRRRSGQQEEERHREEQRPHAGAESGQQQQQPPPVLLLQRPPQQQQQQQQQQQEGQQQQEQAHVAAAELEQPPAAEPPLPRQQQQPQQQLQLQQEQQLGQERAGPVPPPPRRWRSRGPPPPPPPPAAPPPPVEWFQARRAYPLQLLGLGGVAAASLVALSASMLVLPLAAGRGLFAAAGLAVKNDLFAGTVGGLTLWGAAAAAAGAARATSLAGLRAAARAAGRWAALSVKLAALVLLWVGVVATLIGVLFELVLLPLRLPPNQTALIYLHTNWTFGVLALKLGHMLAVVRGRERRAGGGGAAAGGANEQLNAWDVHLEALQAQGLRELDFGRALTRIVLPALDALLIALAAPYVLTRGLLPLLGLPARALQVANLYGYAVCHGLYLSYLASARVRAGLKELHNSIRDDRYLLGRRLNNLGAAAAAAGGGADVSGGAGAGAEALQEAVAEAAAG